MRSSRPLRCVLPWLCGVLVLGLVGIAVEQPVHAQVLYGSVIGGVTDQIRRFRPQCHGYINQQGNRPVP